MDSNIYDQKMGAKDYLNLLASQFAEEIDCKTEVTFFHMDPGFFYLTVANLIVLRSA